MPSMVKAYMKQVHMIQATIMCMFAHIRKWVKQRKSLIDAERMQWKMKGQNGHEEIGGERRIQRS